MQVRTDTPQLYQVGARQLQSSPVGMWPHWSISLASSLGKETNILRRMATPPDGQPYRLFSYQPQSNVNCRQCRYSLRLRHRPVSSNIPWNILLVCTQFLLFPTLYSRIWPMLPRRHYPRVFQSFSAVNVIASHRLEAFYVGLTIFSLKFIGCFVHSMYLWYGTLAWYSAL